MVVRQSSPLAWRPPRGAHSVSAESVPGSGGSMQVRLSEITVAARARLAPLTAEVAGYIVWLVATEALADARSVSAERIGVTAAGEVTLAAGEPEPALDSERELRRLLGDLLALCQSGTPALKRASERAASGDLESLQRELGAALIPINHAASRRALARLYRETDRAREELVAPVVIVEDDDAPGATATVTLPSPGPLPSLLEPDWATPTSGVLQRCDTMPSAPAELVLEPEAELEPSDEAPPPWLAVALCDQPGTAAHARHGESEPPATVGTTLRSAVAAELLEIDVQFARDTERPRPGWPAEWHADSPALPGAELVPAPLAVPPSWNDHELEAAAPETVPDESQRRTPPGLATVARLGELEVSPETIAAREPQTLRVSTPAESGIAARHRSDLGQLLSRFLSDSGSDERITKDLRRSMGLELEAERLSEDERSRAVGS
jgi:hypothetical protein